MHVVLVAEMQKTDVNFERFLFDIENFMPQK